MRALIVDDSETNAELLELFLSPFGECETASNGKLAVEAFEAALSTGKPFDLVCLDIMMPEMDGQAALRLFRQVEAARGIPEVRRSKIIMITAARARENLIMAFRGACDAYMDKPVSKVELMRHLYSLGVVPADQMVRVLLKIV